MVQWHPQNIFDIELFPNYGTYHLLYCFSPSDRQNSLTKSNTNYKSYALECVLMDSNSTTTIKLMCSRTSQYWLCHQTLFLPPKRQMEKSGLATRDYAYGGAHPNLSVKIVIENILMISM